MGYQGPELGLNPPPKLASLNTPGNFGVEEAKPLEKEELGRRMGLGTRLPLRGGPFINSTGWGVSEYQSLVCTSRE